MKKGIYKFESDCGRMGTVSGVFIATDEDVKNKLIGAEVYFGEILGKHSEVVILIEEDEVHLVSDNPEFVKIAEENDLESGYNPFDYLDEDEE